MLVVKRSGWYRRPVISVASSDIELLDWIKATTGTGSIVPKRKKRAAHHRDSWQWRAKDDKALEIIRLVSPYLKITRKRKRAELLISRYKAVTPHNGWYTEEGRKLKEEFEAEFAGL